MLPLNHCAQLDVFLGPDVWLGTSVPVEVGEVVHRSPHATLGYYEDDAKTAEAFAHGWFHSGDLDGHLYAVDRKKDRIKTGGEDVVSRRGRGSLHDAHVRRRRRRPAQDPSGKLLERQLRDEHAGLATDEA